ncbi:hypothetical protein AWT69_004536 [Pseudomonas putida]|nr:hypothetical protein AWT69_004536 [Pseudomonas putida]
MPTVEIHRALLIRFSGARDLAGASGTSRWRWTDTANC